MLNFQISLPLKILSVATLSETHGLTSEKELVEDASSKP